MKIMMFILLSCITLQPSYAEKELGSTGYNYFGESRKEIQTLLSHSIFKKYLGYIVENIRQGEIGESQVFLFA